MANIPPPKKKNAVSKSVAPKVKLSDSPLDQAPPEQKVQLQLKVDGQLRNEFKAFCSIRGRKMNDVFAEMFEQYRANHG